jgi:radical SAM superfamily enzyme YgiQ (UPF0313 family)
MIKPRILLLSCYELGHQPLNLALPLAFLREADFAATAVDLSVSPFPTEDAAKAQLVAISVPMHTALRLGVQAARKVRELNPAAQICFFGLYAWLNAAYLLHGRNGQGRPPADSVIAGESEQVLLAMARAIAQGRPPTAVAGVTSADQTGKPVLDRLPFPVPDRSSLPPLSRYAHFVDNGRAVAAGYVEASRGCLHTCRHCPVVPVYEGRFFVVPVETVMADVRQQVAAGAGHITFGDPDFLNGPGHALRVAQALHCEFPTVTFDFTAKVEHILEKQALLPELRRLGAAFVVSAFESVSDVVLERLAKGHTSADLDRALTVLAEAGLPVQPTWVPFTPWTRLDDYLLLLDWIRRRNLVSHVPVVQLAIRLLIPPGSHLLQQPDAAEWLGSLEPENFNYHWQHPDARVDQLQRQVWHYVDQRGQNVEPSAAFAQVEQLAYRLAGRPPPGAEPRLELAMTPPRLTENWFC